MKEQIQHVTVALVLGMLTFLAIYFDWFSGWNLSLQDTFYQQENRVDSSIKLIVIDEKTLDKLGPFERWTREPYAELLDTLYKDGSPRAVGFDILLIGEKGAEDKTFVDACKKYPNVVLASNIIFDTKIVTYNGKVSLDPLHIEQVELPYGEIGKYARVGFVNAVQDNRDNSVRYALLKQGEYRAFATVLAEIVLEEDPLTALPTDENGGVLIDYTAPPNMYETFSMVDVLEGKIPAKVFQDSVVLVGTKAAGMGDAYLTPIQKGAQMYGVEIHANILQSLLEQRCLTVLPLCLNALCAAVLVFCVTLLLFCIKIWQGGMLVTALIIVEGLLCQQLDNYGLVINILILPLGLVAALVISIVGKYIAEALQKKKIINAFRKYVAPQVVEDIARRGDYQLKLGGEKRHIAVLFVDIRGFTPLSEALTPEQVVEILNEYLGLVTDAIFNHGGTLDKFIGDAAMAVFNAPFDSEDYIYETVAAAKDIAAESERIASKCRERFGREVSYGIGVHCGEAVVGNIGSDFRMDYTAIGDTVNTAARLESNAAPGQILISQVVYDALEGRIAAAPVGELPLKGKAQKLMVYEVELN